MSVLTKELWERIDAIPGWLHYSAASVTASLVAHQRTDGVNGSFLELGVYKGKYLSLLHWLSGPSSRVVGVDGFFAGYLRELDPKWVEPAKRKMLDAVTSVSGNTDRLEIVKANTLALRPTDLMAKLGQPLQFVSVDAGHECDEVLNDLALVAPLLGDRGILALDDVFNPIVPGVTEAVVRYMTADRSIRPFAYAGNKLFVCKAQMQRHYFSVVEEIAATGVEPFHECSRAHAQRNREIGYAPKMFGVDVFALTHDADFARGGVDRSG